MSTQSTSLVETFTHLIIDAKNQKTIIRIARSYTKGTSTSWEDAAQTAIAKVLEGLRAGKFRQGGIEEFQRWAKVVARYEIINLVQKERLRNCRSLDEMISGTDLSLIDAIPDEFNMLDALARTDLIIKVKEAIITLDLRYPERGYLKLWQGMLEDKKQTQIASELKISQGEISKRWKELVERIAAVLGIK
jgi:RNA polymerase sigma factor (sigma-70 family)